MIKFVSMAVCLLVLLHSGTCSLARSNNDSSLAPSKDGSFMESRGIFSFFQRILDLLRSYLPAFAARSVDATGGSSEEVQEFLRLLGELERLLIKMNAGRN